MLTFSSQTGSVFTLHPLAQFEWAWTGLVVQCKYAWIGLDYVEEVVLTIWSRLEWTGSLTNAKSN